MEVWILYGQDIDSNHDLAHEVRRFIAEGAKMDVDVKVYKPSQFDLLVNEDVRDSVLIDGQPTSLPDFFFPYLDHSDRTYFSLAIVRQMERLGVRIFNKSSTIETVADKLHTHQILAENKLPTPITMLAKFPVDMELVERTIGFPVVVKTLLGANGTGVFLLESPQAFNDLMNLIGETNMNVQLIFQKFVAHSKGRDLRLFVMDGEVIACMERRARDGGFKANYSTGGTVAEYIPDQQAIDMAVKTAKVLDIQVAGIDLLFTEDGYTICEANTFPGFKGLESACPVNVPEAMYNAMRRRIEAEQGGDSTVPFETLVKRPS